jgi:hypothetical protein
MAGGELAAVGSAHAVRAAGCYYSCCWLSSSSSARQFDVTAAAGCSWDGCVAAGLHPYSSGLFGGVFVVLLTLSVSDGMYMGGYYQICHQANRIVCVPVLCNMHLKPHMTGFASSNTLISGAMPACCTLSVSAAAAGWCV